MARFLYEYVQLLSDNESLVHRGKDSTARFDELQSDWSKRRYGSLALTERFKIAELSMSSTPLLGQEDEECRLKILYFNITKFNIKFQFTETLAIVSSTTQCKFDIAIISEDGNISIFNLHLMRISVLHCINPDIYI